MKIVSVSYLMTLFFSQVDNKTAARLVSTHLKLRHNKLLMFYKLQFQRQGHMLKYILFHL